MNTSDFTVERFKRIIDGCDDVAALKDICKTLSRATMVEQAMAASLMPRPPAPFSHGPIPPSTTPEAG